MFYQDSFPGCFTLYHFVLSQSHFQNVEFLKYFTNYWQLNKENSAMSNKYIFQLKDLCSFTSWHILRIKETQNEWFYKSRQLQVNVSLDYSCRRYWTLLASDKHELDVKIQEKSCMISTSELDLYKIFRVHGVQSLHNY